MKSSEYFEQTETHNGQQPEKNEQELVEAARLFTELTKKIFRENSDATTSYRSGEETQLDMLLRKQVTSDSDYLSVGVHKKLNKKIDHDSPYRPSEIYLEDITIQQIEDDKGRELLSYRLNADGIVRRWNGGDVYKKLEEKRSEEKLVDEALDMLEGYDLDEDTFYSPLGANKAKKMTSLVEKSLDDMMNVNLPISRLEEDLGYQNQPVGVEEIKRLMKLLEEE